MLSGAVVIVDQLIGYGIIAALICGVSSLIHKILASLKPAARFILLKFGLITVHNPYKFFSLNEKNNLVRTSYAKLIECLKKRAKQFNAANSERNIDINTIGDHEAIIRLYGKEQDRFCRIVLDYLYDGQAIKVFDTQDKDYYQAD